VIDERWIEIGDSGYQVRYRQQNPPEVIAEHPGSPSMVIEDDKSVAVYYGDKKGVILYGKDHQFQWIGPLGEFFDDLRENGSILKENDQYQGRPAHKVWWPKANAECYVDPQTKLPFALGKTELEYKEPPAGTFEIVIPEGYAVLDKRPGAPTATTAPDWLQQVDNAETNKEEWFNQGMRAIVRADYAEAAKFLQLAVPCDSWARFWLGKAYYELGQYDLAIKNYSTMFDAFKSGSGGTLPYCQYARGLAYARLGQLDKAQADLQACLPAMIRSLRTASSATMFEYADSPLIRANRSEPGEREIVPRMINRLRLITGQDFGYDPNLTPQQNEAAIAAWEQWFKNGGQIQFTLNAPQIPVPADWINRLGWGPKSSQQIAAQYRPAWLDQVTDPETVQRVAFALYDTARYAEALAMFERMEARAGDSQRRQVRALLWQGHMLDLLGRRAEAIKRYKEVADMGLDSEMVQSQYNLKFQCSPYAKERMATPFTRLENTRTD
jgi:tetratricopeptide (TPR) repeat protein